MADRGKPSLRTELLLNIAILAAGALALAIVSALLVPLFGGGVPRLALLVVLVAADLLIFVLFGHYLVTRLITRPIDRLVEATAAVATGDLARRAPEGPSRELDRLAQGMNAMTERLLDARSALIRSEKLASVGRLAAGIAHEVGNPLAAIGNYIEVLRRRGAEPEIVDAVNRETARIDRIVRGLLAYARPRASSRERLDAGALAQETVALLTDQGALRQVKLRVSVDDQTPAIEADRGALEQVLVNLILNAVDAAGDGGEITLSVTPTVLGRAESARRSTDPGSSSAPREQRRASRHLAGRPDGTPAAMIVVADDGPGVPEEMASRIFDPFFTTKDPGRGTGLGLAIVQSIVEDHGGRVDVSRAREGGAVFTVTLPPSAA